MTQALITLRSLHLILFHYAACVIHIPLPQHQAHMKGGGRSGRDCLQETYAHRQAPALQLPPPSKCKEGSRQESLQQGQERYSTEREPARGRTPHHHFQTEQLSLTLHLCHLFHTVTINVTRGGVR